MIQSKAYDITRYKMTRHDTTRHDAYSNVTKDSFFFLGERLEGQLQISVLEAEQIHVGDGARAILSRAIFEQRFLAKIISFFQSFDDKIVVS